MRSLCAARRRFQEPGGCRFWTDPRRARSVFGGPRRDCSCAGENGPQLTPEHRDDIRARSSGRTTGGERTPDRVVGGPWHFVAPAFSRRAAACTAACRLAAIHRGQGCPVRAAVSRAHGCLPGALGGQDFGQVGLLARLRQRVAARAVREASHQVLRLRQQEADPVIGRCSVQAPRRRAHDRGLPTVDRRYLPLPRRRFRRGGLARRRSSLRPIVPRTGCACGTGDLPVRQWRARMDLL